MAAAQQSGRGGAHDPHWPAVIHLRWLLEPGHRREALTVLLLLALFIFSWRSVGLTRFNGLDTPLFLSLAAFCLWYLALYPVRLSRAAVTAYAMWAGWVLFSDFYSARFLPAFARDAHWLVLPIFAVQAAQILRDAPFTLPLLRVTAALSVIAIALQLLMAAPGIQDWIREPVFGHIRHLALAVGALVVWLYDTDGLGRVGRLTVTAARFAGLVILCWAGGRGVLLALAAAIIVHTLLRPSGRRHAWIHVVEFVAAALVSELISIGHSSLGLLNSVQRSVTAPTADLLTSARLSLWSATWERLAAGMGFWFGWGGNGFARMGLAQGFIFHPHNIVLQMLTDWGVVGTLLFANFLRVVVRPLSGIVLSSPASALSISLAAYLLLTGLIDGGLYHLQFLIAAALTFALLLQQARDDAPRAAHRLAPAILVAVILIPHLLFL